MASKTKAAESAEKLGLQASLAFSPNDVDFDLWESAVSTVVNERLEQPRWRDRLTLKRYNRNGFLRRLVTARARKTFIEEGGDVEDVQSFLDWLIANWDSILSMVMSIINLFA